jgi:RimJ/RimL family protein N-acetyltransferase
MHIHTSQIAHAHALPVLTTTRLSLYPFAIADVLDLYSIRGDDEAMAFWDWPKDGTVAQTREVAQTILLEVQAGGALYLTARLRLGDFVGVFDLSALSVTSADLGFMVARRHWRQGYATEAAGALIEEAQRRGLQHLTARIHERNVASSRLLHNVGFRPTLREQRFMVALGRTIPCALYKLDLPRVRERGPT